MKTQINLGINDVLGDVHSATSHILPIHLFFFSPYMKDMLGNSFPYIKARHIMRQQQKCQSCAEPGQGCVSWG